MKNELDVFDYNQEKDLVKFEAGTFLEKFKNPKSDDSEVLNCEFVEYSGEDNAIRAPQLNSASCEQSLNFKKDNCGSGNCISELVSRDSCARVPSPEKSLLHSGNLESPSNNVPVDVNFDADGSMDDASASSPASDTVQDSVSLNGHASDQWVDDLEVNVPVEVNFDADGSLDDGSASSPVSDTVQGSGLLSKFGDFLLLFTT